MTVVTSLFVRWWHRWREELPHSFVYKIVEGLMPAMPADTFLTAQKQRRQIRSGRSTDSVSSKPVENYIRNNDRCYTVQHWTIQSLLLCKNYHSLEPHRQQHNPLRQYWVLQVGPGLTTTQSTQTVLSASSRPWPRRSAYGPPPPLRTPTRRTNAGFLHAMLATYAAETERKRRHIFFSSRFQVASSCSQLLHGHCVDGPNGRFQTLCPGLSLFWSSPSRKPIWINICRDDSLSASASITMHTAQWANTFFLTMHNNVHSTVKQPFSFIFLFLGMHNNAYSTVSQHVFVLFCFVLLIFLSILTMYTAQWAERFFLSIRNNVYSTVSQHFFLFFFFSFFLFLNMHNNV